MEPIVRECGWLGRALLVACVLMAPSLAQAQEERASDDPTFSAAAHVLLRRCVECHREGNASGGLRLDSRDGVASGGDSGAAFDLDEPSESELLRRIDDAEMPPPEKGMARPLSDDERAAVSAWLAAGAPWPDSVELDPFAITTDVRAGRDWWAWQRLQPSPSPTLRLSDQSNYIDAYVDRRLADHGLNPAPEATRSELLRRLTYDLTGLPVSAADNEAFLRDSRPDAYERQVDRLLASPRLGERWARQWLDVVRYADTSGYERDQEKPFAWRYRDWVIDAINRDLPFDQFVVDQLAGDERPGADRDSLIATGMLRLGTWNDEPNDPHEYQYERLEDMVHVTFSAFMGLTVKCARCHDHKFDPIPQVDYYRVAAAFWAGPIRPASSNLLGGPSPELLSETEVLAWTDIGRDVPDLHRLHAGDPHRPREVVEPGVLSLLPELDQPFSTVDFPATTGRRWHLAQWLVDPRNALPRRVFVNRLWLGHFGAGLVRSPNNFGFTGELPTHPELLDRLALELGEGEDAGIKRLHRRMVTSAAYRRSAEHSSAHLARDIDANNRFWWHGQRRRLDAEAIRDALLVATGQLDLRMGGPGFRPTLSSEATEGLSRRGSAWSASPAAEQRRRAIYEHASRSLVDPLLTTFDFPDTTLPCGQRDTSIVAPQALTLLNDPLLERLAQSSVDRWLHIVHDEDAPLPEAAEQELIDRLFTQVLARSATADEIELAREHLRSVRREAAAQMAGSSDAPTTEAMPETANAWPSGLVLALLADEGVTTNGSGQVEQWADQSGHEHHARQPNLEARPIWNMRAETPELLWDGNPRWLDVAGELLARDHCTIVAVARDSGPAGLREIISNWNGAEGNATTSLFLGLAGERTIRFSDAWPASGEFPADDSPHILMAVNGEQGARVMLDGATLADRDEPLAPRRLDTAWVVGTQGNIGGEYWQGGISAVLVFDRALSDAEQTAVGRLLADRFAGRWEAELPAPPRSAEQRAWESLLIVLLNTNEFLYVD